MRIASAAVALLLLSGCGSSTAHPAASSAPALTKAQFIVRADNACRKVQAAGTRVLATLPALERSVSRARMQAGATALRRYFADVRLAASEIGTLHAPAGAEKQIRLLLRTYEEEARLGGELADAFGREEPARRKELGAAIAVLVRFVHEIAHGYGFRVCGA
jgi:hypothetical protein